MKTKVQKALDILYMMREEIPKTMGEINVSLVYEDLVSVIKILEE